MSEEIITEAGFADFELATPVLRALDKVGYETPTPIQAQTIPLVLAGKDVVGQAQTGTGKTAAFALPLLSRIDVKKLEPQVLVLAPTRELAIQVAEAFQRYAANMRNFHVLPIYGGQDYQGQFRRLKRGVHVVVGTPGRLMDHMRRGTLKLEALSCLVLDEADEMLRMGFIDDVEWILDQTPKGRQVALFSATMPSKIRGIAQKYLNDPAEITIEARTATVETTRQRFWMVSGYHKLDALTRILETEDFDGVLMFVRTKSATVELSRKLEARGYASAPLSSDVAQSKRERTIDQLKSGKLNIIVATDVAARGLDVDRISHVINYDIPYDTEAYVHRIGRTGRAGRSGEAILFVSPREKRMLRTIEKGTKQRIEMMELPSTEAINDRRIAAFKQRITDTLAVEELGFFYQLVEQYQQEHNTPAMEIAAALARLVQGESELLLSAKPTREEFPAETQRESRREKRPRPGPRRERGAPGRRREAPDPDIPMATFRIEVGRRHGVEPGNIVGAISNEAVLDSRFIGRINIFDDHSTVDLPEGMPAPILRELKKVWVAGQQLRITKLGRSGKRPSGGRKGGPRPGGKSDRPARAKKGPGKRKFKGSKKSF